MKPDELVEEIKSRHISPGHLVEICLVPGARFDMVASSVPTAYAPETKTEELREQFVAGYVAETQRANPEQGRDYLDLLHGRTTNPPNSLSGGFRVNVEAIGRIRKMTYEDLTRY